MTIREAIAAIDDLKHNTYTDHRKLQWLSALECSIQKNIIDNCRESELQTAAPFDDTTPMDTALLAPSPYDEMYIHYLAAQMDYHNAEFDRYNNAMAMFRTVYDEFRAFHNRTHIPKSGKIRYF